MSDDLVTWLRARFDDAERVARAAGWHRWQMGVVYGTVIAAGNGKTVARDCREYDAEHIARHDPARVLGEVEAKRLRLGEIERELADDPDNDTAMWLLCVEALPYADRPGYRAEWRPA